MTRKWKTCTNDKEYDKLLTKKKVRLVVMGSTKKRPFAQGICYDKLLIIFVIGCIVGTYYEELLTLVKIFLRTGDLVWESHRGVIYGPFNPLYGFGLVLITWVFCRKKEKRTWWQTFLLAALLGGVIEYGISYLQELFVGTVSWDYSRKFLNIHGRTTIPFMFFWGLTASLYIYKIYPYISSKIEQLPHLMGKIIVIFFTIFLSLDMIISFTALYRQDLRRRGIPPYTKIGEFYDKHYTDEFLEKYYTNMKPITKEGE